MEIVETETFQQQAFEVRLPDETFDPSSEPKSGEEFLMKVIHERKNCPAIVTKHPKIRKEIQPQTVIIPERPIMDDLKDGPPNSLRPTNEWKLAQAADFIATRNKINELRHELQLHNYSTDHEIPLTEEESEWEKFCQSNPPLLSTILRINQRTLERLIRFQSEWLNDNEEEPVDKEIESENHENMELDNTATATLSGFCSKDIDLANKDEWLASWIYSTLVCLRLPLEPDVHSILRDIARQCIRLRNKLGNDDLDKAAPYNLLTSIISNVFDQLDLDEFV